MNKRRKSWYTGGMTYPPIELCCVIDCTMRVGTGDGLAAQSEQTAIILPLTDDNHIQHRHRARAGTVPFITQDRLALSFPRPSQDRQQNDGDRIS